MGLKRTRGTENVQPWKFYHKTLGAAQLTPQKYRRQLKTTILKGPVQVDYSFPESIEGDRTFVDLNQNDPQYEGATLTTIDEELLAIDELVSYQRTSVAQTETVTEQIVLETDPPPPLSELVNTMTQEALGNGKSILTFGTVPYLFTEQSYKKEIVGWMYSIPRQFRGILPVQESSALSAGIAVPPTLGLGELSHEEAQVNVFVKKDTSTFRDLSILPVSVTDFKMTSKKQLETLIATMSVGDAEPIPIDALTEEATSETTGDGTWVATIGTVPDLFTEENFEISIPDVIPEKFRVVVPTQRHALLVEGVASTPTLATSELSPSS
jgi:hypothetical protein